MICSDVIWICQMAKCVSQFWHVIRYRRIMFLPKMNTISLTDHRIYISQPWGISSRVRRCWTQSIDSGRLENLLWSLVSFWINVMPAPTSPVACAQRKPSTFSRRRRTFRLLAFGISTSLCGTFPWRGRLCSVRSEYWRHFCGCRRRIQSSRGTRDAVRPAREHLPKATSKDNAMLMITTQC